MHVVVSRSAFRSQNCQTLPGSEHFSKLRCSKSVRRCGVKHILMSKCTPRSGQLWTLRCRKSACRCGAKHISKLKCTRHTTFRALLEVEMSKKCMPLWREAHFEVKCEKHATNAPHYTALQLQQQQQTSKQTNKQPTKQASKQATKQASKHTNIKTNKHTLDKIGSFRSF